MTNEERIYKLCEYVIDLIEEIQYLDKKLDGHFDWVADEIKSIREDIDNSQKKDFKHYEPKRTETTTD